MSSLKFAPGISSDFVRFLQRLLIFYSYNAKQSSFDPVIGNILTTPQRKAEANEMEHDLTQEACPYDSRLQGMIRRLKNCKLQFHSLSHFDEKLAHQAKMRLEVFYDRIVPDCKTLSRYLKRRLTLSRVDLAPKECALFVILLRLIEERLLCAIDYSGEARKEYVKSFLPLAKAFYEHHCTSDDIDIAEVLVKHQTTVYFPKVQGRKSREAHLAHYNAEQLKWHGVETASWL